MIRINKTGSDAGHTGSPLNQSPNDGQTTLEGDKVQRFCGTYRVKPKVAGPELFGAIAERKVYQVATPSQQRAFANLMQRDVHRRQWGGAEFKDSSPAANRARLALEAEAEAVAKKAKKLDLFGDLARRLRDGTP